ncbi:ABC transporter ATP-binding protein [Haliscomenobacter hydrossis]|uniref:Nickel-transporting ATPase n=1 Tax=Haliscomenobacter hydrossis (strain ATCC 27775 / DSM 1100 / LMG 10767 / O) TaxID=760192 RepID=F4L2H9_HALH1|nr:ABC transporter ATP-binding protein [Haliscomenobacter hydrossis]AEE53897.1 Nickel-transporting ATPase [Haliscomenobacter hydrossis DSM 1100]
MEHLLEVQRLNIHFGEKAVVENLSFVLPRGKTLAIVGESGSGKSLSALSLLGLLPSNAQISAQKMCFSPLPDLDYELLKLPPTTLQSIRGRAIGMIFQEPMSSLNPLQRCGQQIDEVLRRHLDLNQTQSRKRSLEWLERVKIQDPERIYRAYPHEISGGQKQRVMIAMAMCCHPALLLADEPTTALDATVQKEILLLMQELQTDFNTSILFISHDLSLVAGFADEVLVMHQGKLIESGPVDAIFESPQAAYTKALLHCRPPIDRRVQRLPTIEDYEQEEVTEVLAAEIPKKPSPDALPLLEVEHLSTWFPLRKSWFGQPRAWLKAVQDASFSIKKGQTLGLVGESGSGKTTLGRSILRLIEPSGGQINFAGQNLSKLQPEALRSIRREMQIVFQDPYSSLNPRLPVGLAITEPMKVHGIGVSEQDRVKRAIDLLEQVGLSAEHFQRFPHEFSGGQRQRLCIARALAVQPSLLVCDEAVSSLDVSVQATVLNLLKDLQAKQGLTYLFISHDLAVIRFMCDEVMVMKDGVIVEKGAATQVFEAPVHPYTQALLAASR